MVPAKLQERIEIAKENDGTSMCCLTFLAHMSASCPVMPFRSARSDAR